MVCRTPSRYVPFSPSPLDLAHKVENLVLSVIRRSYWITSSVEFDPDDLVERLEIGLLFSRLVLESQILLLGDRGGNVRGLEDLDTVLGDSMGSLRWVRCMFLLRLPQLHGEKG